MNASKNCVNQFNMLKARLTKEQKDFIRANYLTMNSTKIISIIGGTKNLVLSFRKLAGLTISQELKQKFRVAGMVGKTTFTAAEDEQICREYLDMPIKTLGVKMGRSYTGIMGRLKALGLTIPEDIKARNFAAGRIKPGNVPGNKGKKQVDYMTPEAIARTAGTRFKKGQISHTEKSDGVISIRGKSNGELYKWIRISKAKWVSLHRLNWEAVNGPVPNGHCLWCIDQDTMNCDAGNWELITRKENYRRNSSTVLLKDKYVANTIAWRNRELKKELLNYPEILQLKREQLQLNRAINEKGRN